LDHLKNAGVNNGGQNRTNKMYISHC
jgi:hypothetical protein